MKMTTAGTATRSSSAVFAATLLACWLAPGAAQAQTTPTRAPTSGTSTSSSTAWPEPRTTFQLQGFLPRTSSDTRTDDGYTNKPGTTASAEDDFGLPRNPPTWGLAFMRRIGENWRFDLEYLEQRRTASNVKLRRDINAYGSAYAAGSSVNTRMTLTALRIAGGYTLLRQDATEFGVNFGGIISNYDLDVKGASQMLLNDGHADAQASLGLFASHALSPTLRLQGRFEVGPQNRQVNVGANWRFGGNASLGANLRWMNVKITQSLGAFAYTNDSAEFKLLGPQISLEVGF